MINTVSDKNIKITVLMPVYNGEKYIYEAISSILNQTFTNFEFLIINDGSTDTSIEIIKSFKDPRICLVSNKKNLGLISTLNKGLDLAKGEYIARMDCDDISLSERLDRQVQFMDMHPEVGVCGTWFMYMQTGQIIAHSISHEKIASYLFLNSPLAHSTVMIRTSVIRKTKFYYDLNYKHLEDYELWVRLSKDTRIINIPELLLKYRLHSEQICQKYSKIQFTNLKLIRIKQLKNLISNPTNEEIKLHLSIISNKKVNRFVAAKWIKRLKRANLKTKIYLKKPFHNVLNLLWLNSKIQVKGLNFINLKIILKSFFNKYSKDYLMSFIKYLIYSFINKVRTRIK